MSKVESAIPVLQFPHRNQSGASEKTGRGGGEGNPVVVQSAIFVFPYVFFFIFASFCPGNSFFLSCYNRRQASNKLTKNSLPFIFWSLKSIIYYNNSKLDEHMYWFGLMMNHC